MSLCIVGSSKKKLGGRAITGIWCNPRAHKLGQRNVCSLLWMRRRKSLNQIARASTTESTPGKWKPPRIETCFPLIASSTPFLRVSDSPRKRPLYVLQGQSSIKCCEPHALHVIRTFSVTWNLAWINFMREVNSNFF